MFQRWSVRKVDFNTPGSLGHKYRVVGFYLYRPNIANDLQQASYSVDGEGSIR